MTEQREKNLHFSSILSELEEHGPDGPVNADPEPEAAARASGSQVQSEPAREGDPEPAQAPRPRSAAPWLFLFVIVLAAVFAYSAYLSRTEVAALELRVEQLERQQGSRDESVVAAEEWSELQLRLAELELELQRRSLLTRESSDAGDEESVVDVGMAPEPEPEAEPKAEAVTGPEIPTEQVAESAPVQEEVVRPVTWSVILGSFRERERANRMAERLASADQVIEVLEYERNGSIQFRVAVAGLEDPQQARELSEKLQQQWGLQGLWVSSD